MYLFIYFIQYECSYVRKQCYYDLLTLCKFFRYTDNIILFFLFCIQQSLQCDNIINLKIAPCQHYFIYTTHILATSETTHTPKIPLYSIQKIRNPT